MRKFKITVNGISYDVEVEEVKEGVQQAASPKSLNTTTQTAVAPVPTPKQEQKSTKEIPADATLVESPMPGNAWKVLVKEGDQVKEGQVLIILEAMKMENDIMSPIDGVVASVNVVEGASVNGGDVLVSLG